MADPIAFIDLQAQRRRLGEPLNRAIQAAVEAGQWILGPQVAQLERELAAWAGVKHAVACANGTDALLLVLRAWGVGPGDAVFVPAFTFAATGEVVALAAPRRCLSMSCPIPSIWTLPVWKRPSHW